MENEHVNNGPSDDKSFIRVKRFHLVMLLFFVVFLSAGITTFALAFGDEKAVAVINERKEFAKLYSVFDTIMENYYTDVDQKELVNGAINGMIDSLKDPYSDYMNEDEAMSFHQSISSSFEGIGAEIQEKDGYIVIVSPIKGSPAEKAGLKPEDKILEVDGDSIRGMSSTEAVMLIRGDKGTTVELTIERAGIAEPIVVSIVRDTIPIETVYGEMMDEKIAKVQITSFAENTAAELIDTLNQLQKEGMEGLILDLRQNPGGLLDQAITISSLFVPEGKTLFKIEDRDGNVEEMKSTNKNYKKFPLVVVIDKGSASASEILAAAVSESADVPLVGEKSFGKGTVQRSQSFSDGSNLKFTTEKWLTPKENWIHNKGITPDYEVSLPDYTYLTIINPNEQFTLNSSSPQIQSAQGMLKALGFDPGREDGFFDEKTEEALKGFQEANKLEPTGVLTGETSRTLMEKLSEMIRDNDTQLLKAKEVLLQQMNSNN